MALDSDTRKRLREEVSRRLREQALRENDHEPPVWSSIDRARRHRVGLRPRANLPRQLGGESDA
jgi:hypothetical protein